MKNLNKILFAAALLCGFTAAAALPSAWQHAQEFEITAPGLVKINLPVDTLDAARPALEDLRLCDDAGNELPFLITRPVPSGKAVRPAKSFQVSLQPNSTVITLETGLTQPLDGVTLETPAGSFIKSVRVEGSSMGANWQLLAAGQLIFRQPNGAGNLKIIFPATPCKSLRLTIDDQRSQPVPFTGANVHAGTAEIIPVEFQTAAITERNESPGETRLTLNLGAANLDVAAVQIETGEPLFTRTVTLAVPQVTEAGVFEQVIGQGVIYRVAIEGQPATANLFVPLETKIRSRELILLIRNGDSPPLPITAVRVERRPVYLTFMARQAGTFHLLTGNKSCAAPRYDLAALGADLKNTVLSPVKISALTDNPDFRAPEALGGLEVNGAPLDVSAWKYRKPVLLAESGAQQVELDLEVLSHANADFSDLRVMRGSNQVPFIIQRTSINRAVKLSSLPIKDPKNPQLSRWLISLPQPGLPLTRLTCVSQTPLFRRTMSLYEERTDDRGATFRYPLGTTDWAQIIGTKPQEFSLPIGSRLQGKLLTLETDNGDNPPIELKDFQAFYPATRLLFKANKGDTLYICYGNPRVLPPSYDLNLVAGELLAADKHILTLFPEDQLKKDTWGETQTPGKGGILFWGILAVVVVGLLAIISRLLPKTTASGDAQPPK